MSIEIKNKTSQDLSVLDILLRVGESIDIEEYFPDLSLDNIKEKLKNFLLLNFISIREKKTPTLKEKKKTEIKETVDEDIYFVEKF